jgi:hypothetical protein
VSDFIQVKFTYNNGSPQSLTPAYAPINKLPVDAMSAVRHDSFTRVGQEQFVTERVDRVFDLEFKVVPQAQISDWETFITHAINGGQFEFYPDATSEIHATCHLVDTEWTPKRGGAPGIFTFTLKIRKVVA